MSLQAIRDEAIPEPTPQQLAYRLECGSRFALGHADGNSGFTAAVIQVNNAWLEYEYEGQNGQPITPRLYTGVSIRAFRASILRELPALSPKEKELRGYR